MLLHGYDFQHRDSLLCYFIDLPMHRHVVVAHTNSMTRPDMPAAVGMSLYIIGVKKLHNQLHIYTANYNTAINTKI